MKREKAYLPEEEERAEEIVAGERDEEWIWVHEETTSVDLEKGIEYKDIILRRKSDMKLFKFECPQNSQHSLFDLVNKWPVEGTEVFLVEKIIKTYE